MKKIIFALLIAIPVLSRAQLNGSFVISGRVTAENGVSLPSASVQIKGTSHGTTADSTGFFSLVISQKFPFTLVVTSVGYYPQEIEVKNQNSSLSVQLSS